MKTHLLACATLTLITAAGLSAEPVKPCHLMDMLASVDAVTARRGTDGFIKMGAGAAVPLICYIAGQATGAAKPTDLGKSRAEKALVTLGGKAVPALLEKLGTQSEELRARLVRVLGQITDARRTAPLTKLWSAETSDRVRAQLVGAIVAVKGPGKAIGLLRARIASAGTLERQALAVQLALHGAAADLRKLIAPLPALYHASFIELARRELRAIGTSAARAAIKRLDALD